MNSKIHVVKKTNKRSSFVLSRYHVISPVMFDMRTKQNFILLFSTRSLQTCRITVGLWNKIIEEKFDDISEVIFDNLIALGLIVPKNLNELSEIIKSNQSAAESSTTLYECIQPTANCNFGCEYCGQDHQNKLLSDINQDLLFKRIIEKLKNKKYQKLRIGWFGGEPLLGIKVIRSLSPKFISACQELNISYEAHIVTNGYSLNKKIAQELSIDYKIIKFEITLDGPQEIHDQRRFTKNKTNTFNKILENLVEISNLENFKSDLVIRCNVDKNNADHIMDLINHLSHLGLQKLIKIYFAPIHDWGNTASKSSLPLKIFAEREIDWIAQLASKGFSTSLIPSLKPIVCMAVNPHAEMVDPYGQLFNCTEVSLTSSYGTPNKYSKGNLLRDNNSTAANKLSDFNTNIDNNTVLCNKCAMLPMCGGACPKQWQDGQIPCPSPKINMSERLSLAYAFSIASQTSIQKQ